MMKQSVYLCSVRARQALLLALVALVAVACAAVPVIASAQQPSLSSLPVEACDDFGAQILFDTGNALSGVCLLRFTPSTAAMAGDTSGDEKALEVQYHGRRVKLHRTGARPGKGPRSATFVSADGHLRLWYAVRVVKNSCGEGEAESENQYCGQNYAGSLTLKSPQGTEVYPVNFYRGG